MGWEACPDLLFFSPGAHPGVPLPLSALKLGEHPWGKTKLLLMEQLLGAGCFPG